MIHSLSGGVITQYDKFTYVFVRIEGGAEDGVKRWYISPFPAIKAGDRVEIPTVSGEGRAEVLRVEIVTAQTAPFPIKRTKEISGILRND